MRSASLDRPESLLAEAYIEAICQITDDGGLYAHLAADEIGTRLWREIKEAAVTAPDADMYALTRAALAKLKTSFVDEKRRAALA